MTRGDLRKLKQAVAKMTPGPLDEDAIRGQDEDLTSHDISTLVLLRNHAAELIAEMERKMLTSWSRIKTAKGDRVSCNGLTHRWGPGCYLPCNCDPVEVEKRVI